MIEITATGDTTLHTAGKYCAEDILVKVPAGGSSSGGGFDVCSVTINHSGLSGGYVRIIYTAVENGTIVAEHTSVDPNELPYTINNCLCRSSLSINYSYARYYLAASITSNIGALGDDGVGYSIYLSAPTTPNTSGTITLYDSD